MDDSPDARIAVATIRAGGGSWPGVRDRFGERATAVDAEGRSVELLRLFAAFTPAFQALADRIALLDLDRPAVSRAIALERDEPSSRLIVISEHVPGVRLSELLQAAVQRSIVPDLGVALFVMRRLLTLAESLKAATRLVHFSIAPERIVITPHGRVVIVEPVLAAAADTGAGESHDIAGIAIAGMSIMLGHLIEDAEHIDPLSPVLQDAADVAAIRAGHRFSTALRLWFDRAIIADPSLSFPDFRQARLALSRVGLARESGCDASRRALKVFLKDLAIERLTDVEAGTLEVNRLREMRATRLARWKAIAAPDDEWISVTDELFIGDESRVVTQEIQSRVADRHAEDVDEAIGIGPLAEPDGPAPVEERLEAALVKEILEAESWPASTEPLPEEASTEAVDAVEEGIGEFDEEPIEIAGAEPPVEALEESLAEEAESVAVDMLDRSPPIDSPLKEDEPVGPVDESAAARLSEDAHTLWIQSITEQVGRMRRREEGLPETPFSDNAAATPDVQAAHIQLERAAMPHAQDRTKQPAAWVTPAPAPRGDAASAARTAMPFPAEPADHEYAPHHGVLHEQAAGAQPHTPDAQPAKGVPGPRTVVAAPRRWTRAAATILAAGLALAILAALVIAGRSYYRSVSAPGTIAVDSTPGGSEVLIDGTTRGVTPLTLTLQPGDHVLALRRNGLTRQFSIAVAPGAQLSQRLDWSTVRATGTLAISSTPSQAKVIVDGTERGVTPLTLSDVPVGMRRIVIESSAGTVSREVKVVANSQVAIDEIITSGWIAAFAPFELQIYEGTRLLAPAEDGRIRVPPGRHELDFVNTRLGFRERRGIEVNPGTTTAVNIATVVGIVRITAPAGADVLIDGVLFGDTPLRELRLPIGSHEIVLRHPQLGEQRVSVTVGASAPTEVSVDFTKP